MRKVEKVVKPIKDVKTDVESNLELGSKITLLLDKGLTCKKCCFQDLSSDPRQIEYVDVLNRSWDTVEKRSREMSKFDYVFPGWSKFDYVFSGWWEFLIPSRADGSSFNQLHVPRDRARSRSSKTHL